jgi:signal transduction histidine kinase
MTDRLEILARRYQTALRKFYAKGQEVDLERAYALGRASMTAGLGVLDMARIHQKAIETTLPTLPATGQKRVLHAAEVFFLEALSPFEATHRGFRETNSRLHRLITIQERRNQDLADINRKLTGEIHRRKLTEKALRRSERHFRRLFKEARLMEEGLRNLSNQVLDVQEDERGRISRELHDETGQALTAISVTLAGLNRNGQSFAVRRRMLGRAQRLLQATMETLHDFARELRPAALDELGLLHALRSYLTGFSERTGLRVRFRANPLAEKLSPGVKTVLFRVAQESLTNVAKHAQATCVDFQIRKADGKVCMIIKDNGKSFRKTSEHLMSRKQRLGLLGMQERVRLVNGQFSIRPKAGEGTTVIVTIPLESDGTPRRRRKSSAARN